MSADVMQNHRTSASSPELAISPWEDLFWGFVVLLTPVFLVTLVGPVTLAAMVYWVYGSAGYDNGIRVHFVGKAPWFSNGERVPDSVATVSLFCAFWASALCAFTVAFSIRWLYARLSSKPQNSET